MEICSILNNINDCLKENIGIFSLIVSIIALIANIITNHKNDKHYNNSLRPLLSFEFYQMDEILLLSIKNNGLTEANEIKIKILNLENNGQNNKLMIDDLFKKEFVLYPTEEVQGIVAIFGGTIDQNVFPVLKVRISYINGNDKKKIQYERTITFKRNIYGNNKLSRIEDSIESISYSNNRLANYIEGRTLFRFDKLNVFPHNSLYKDMKDAFNNIEREETNIKDNQK